MFTKAQEGFSPALVGRDAELTLLRTTLDEVTAGSRRLLLLAGDAGIGKTRLADEAATAARAAGARVVWGRCWEGGGAPAYWPWLQVLRELAEDLRASALAGPSAEALWELLGEAESAARTDGAATLKVSPAHHSDSARFYLFDAMTAFLVALSERAPVVVILDDLQTADLSSLLLLRFLARDRREGRLLLLGTYRDLEAHRAAETGQLLTAVGREGRLVRLGGLSVDDVAAFIHRATGTAPGGRLVAQVHAATEGNPLFIDAVVHLLTARGPLRSAHSDALPIPDQIRDTIRQRIAPLSSTARGALAAGAILGHEFDVALAASVCEQPAEALLERCEQALRIGVLRQPRRHPGTLRFAHALIRDTLLDDLPAAQRARLHRRAGEALEQRGGPDADPAQLAHHFFHAGPAADAELMLSYVVRAGRHAFARLAYEDARSHFERAVELSATLPIAEVERCELLLACGDAQGKAGDGARARATFERAAAIARRLGDPERLSGVALRCGGLQPPDGVVDSALDRLLGEALEAVGESNPGLRARLMGRRAMANYYTWPRAEREALTGAAVTVARDLGDRGLLCDTLNARCYALWGLEDVDERLDAAREIVQLARESGDAELALRGHIWRIVAFLERADVTAADAEIETFARIAADLRQPALVWQTAALRAMRALLSGRLRTAGELVDEALRLSPHGEGPQADGLDWLGPNAALTHGVQRFNLRTHQGRLDELEHEVRALTASYPTLPVWRCALAYLCCSPVGASEARALFDGLAGSDFADLPRDGNWLVAMAQLAEVCAYLGDADRAVLLHGLLQPYAGRQIVVGAAIVCRGAVEHYLGLLAATAGADEAADRYFAAALEMHERLGAKVYAMRTLTAWGRTLGARGDPAQISRARELLAQAHEICRELELDHAGELLAERLLALGPVAEDTPQRSAAPATPAARPASKAASNPATKIAPAPDWMRAAVAEPAGSAKSAGSIEAGEAAEPAALATLVREGEYWTFTFGGRTIRLRDAKGLRYLTELLRSPGRELHAIDLAATGEQAAGDLGDAGASLDAEARQAYRRRIAELDDEVEQARADGDSERRASAATERDFIAHELASSLGLGGRDRRAAAHSERARLNVTRALRGAISRIEAADPALAGHLNAAVRTGAFCCYAPDPLVGVRWQLQESS